MSRAVRHANFQRAANLNLLRRELLVVANRNEGHAAALVIEDEHFFGGAAVLIRVRSHAGFDVRDFLVWLDIEDPFPGGLAAPGKREPLAPHERPALHT